MGYNHSDAEMLIASRIAYLDVHVTEETGPVTIGELREAYGNKLPEVLQEAVDRADSCNINIDNWKILDVRNENSGIQGNGFYGCLIETGDGEAILGFRGSESMQNQEQMVKDWVISDALSLKLPLTPQEYSAMKYLEDVYRKYGDRYEYSLTGHSLGGHLAEVASITASERIKRKIDHAINFDGQGVSKSFRKLFGVAALTGIPPTTHYVCSIIGGASYGFPGVEILPIESKGGLILAHDSNNFTIENGSVKVLDDWFAKLMTSGGMREITGFVTTEVGTPLLLSALAVIGGYNMIADTVDAAKELMEEFGRGVKKWILGGGNGIYAVEFFRLQEIGNSMTDSASGMDRISEEVGRIARTLPYFSGAGFMYKHRLFLQSASIGSASGRIRRLGRAALDATGKYNLADRDAASLFR